MQQDPGPVVVAKNASSSSVQTSSTPAEHVELVDVHDRDELEQLDQPPVGEQASAVVHDVDRGPTGRDLDPDGVADEDGVDCVVNAPLKWVDWFNHRRLHTALD